MYWILFLRNVVFLRIVKSKSEIGPIVPNWKISMMAKQSHVLKFMFSKKATKID